MTCPPQLCRDSAMKAAICIRGKHIRPDRSRNRLTELETRSAAPPSLTCAHSSVMNVSHFTLADGQTRGENDCRPRLRNIQADVVSHIKRTRLSLSYQTEAGIPPMTSTNNHYKGYYIQSLRVGVAVLLYYHNIYYYKRYYCLVLQRLFLPFYEVFPSSHLITFFSTDWKFSWFYQSRTPKVWIVFVTSV